MAPGLCRAAMEVATGPHSILQRLEPGEGEEEKNTAPIHACDNRRSSAPSMLPIAGVRRHTMALHYAHLDSKTRGLMCPVDPTLA